MRLPEAIITLLRQQQFSAVLHGEWLLMACHNDTDHKSLDLGAILIEAEPNRLGQQQLMDVLFLISEAFSITHLRLTQNNIYGLGCLLMRGLAMSTLVTLDLSNCGLDGEDLDFLALANACPNLEKLVLAGNDLSPWRETSSQHVPMSQTQGFKAVIENLLSLVYLKKLRTLNLSKTNLGIVSSYLGAVIAVIVSNGVLEHVELHGISLSKKAYAYCIVACSQMRRLSRMPVVMHCEGNKNSDFFKERVQLWNQVCQKENHKQALCILSLFSKRERSENVHQYINAKSDARALSANAVEQCEQIMRSMSTEVNRLWAGKKRREQAVLSPRSKRQRQQIMQQTPDRSLCAQEADLSLTDECWIQPLRLFQSPESGENKSFQYPSFKCLDWESLENIDPQMQIVLEKGKESAMCQLMNLPEEMRVKIAEYLGEHRCPVRII